MSFPASLTTRILKGRFVTYPDGTAAEGTVRFALMDFLQGPADDMFVVPFDRTIPLDEDGAFSIVLPATDDPDWTPSVYKIIVTTLAPSRCVGRDASRIDRKVLRATVRIPYNSTGPLDLADIINLPVPTVGEQYIILASKGVPGGVATLDQDGFITSSQIPPGSGGDVSWNDILDKPSVFPAADPTWDDITGKPSVFPHDPIAFADVTGKPSVYPANPTAWVDVTGKPPTFPHDPIAFSDVTGKPSTYPPDTHTHAFVDITGKPSTYPHDTITWTEISGKPSTFPASSVAFSDITGKPSTYPAAWSDISGMPDLATQSEMEAGDAAVLYTASLAYDASQLALSKLLVLGPSDPIPGGTPAGTVVVRTVA